MPFEEYEIEHRGFEQGINPLMGEFNKTFNFAPVPYGNKDKQSFVDKVRKELANIKYVYTSEIKVSITLYFDEKKRMETPELADLDNYAKLLLDALKGAEGILIDDAQVQSLNISWVDTPSNPYFEVDITGHPDDFINKPLQLYEMPDGFFYPIPKTYWTYDGLVSATTEQIYYSLLSYHEMITVKRKVQHQHRQSGYSQLEAFRKARYFSPTLFPFHKNRVIDSGFEIITLKQWRSEIDFDNFK